MKGIWVWPSEPKDQGKVLRLIAKEDEFVTILSALATAPEGLSNAQLDKVLGNNSQWRTLSHTKELMALGFTQYRLAFFGEAGKHEITDLGRSMLPTIQAAR